MPWKDFSLPFLPANLSSPSRTHEGLFQLTWCPLRALDSPRALLLERQRYKDTARCAELCAEVPGHQQQKLTQTWIVRLLKTHFSTHRSLIVKSQQNMIELVTRPLPQQGPDETQKPRHPSWTCPPLMTPPSRPQQPRPGGRASSKSRAATSPLLLQLRSGRWRRSTPNPKAALHPPPRLASHPNPKVSPQ